MFATFARSVVETLKDGSIVNRLVVVLGLVILLWGLYSSGVVVWDIVNVIRGDGEVNALQPMIRGFIGIVVGAFVLILGNGFEFTWSDEAGH